MNIRKKVLLLLLPLISIPLLLTGWLSYKQLLKTSHNKSLEQLNSLINQIELNVNSDLHALEANTKLFSNSDLLHKYILANNFDRYNLWQRPLLKIFSSYTKTYPSYYEIKVLLPDGFEDTRFTTFDIENKYEEEGQLEYFKKISDSNTKNGILIINNPDNNKTAFLSYRKLIFNDPLFAESEAFRGVLALTVEPKFILQTIKINNLNKKIKLFFSNKNGEILFEHNPINLGNNRLRNMLVSINKNKNSNQYLNVRLNESDYFYRGKQLNPDLFVFTVIPVLEIYKETKNLALIVIALVFISIIITLSLFYYLLNWQIIKPIYELKVSTQLLSKKLIHKSQHTNNESFVHNKEAIETKIAYRNDEIGELGKSFNSMSSKLFEMYNRLINNELRLEKKVSERTEILVSTVEKLKVAEAHANMANQAKSIFLANMSHEIRTPMNGLLSMAELLAQSDLNQLQTDYVVNIRNSGKSLMKILNDILDFSKIEAKQLDIVLEPFHFDELIADVISIIQPMSDNKGLILKYSIDPMLYLTMEGDAGRIRQILLNLLSNAVKFTEQGQIFLQAKLLTSDQQNYQFRVTIEDSGIGIAPEHIPQIFERFSQINDSLSRDYQGSGLGLAICKRIIELMDGTIGVESTLDSGSRFWFELSLPIIEELKEDVQDIEPNEDVTGSCMQILVVDDDPINLLACSTLLENGGHQTYTAENGHEALSLLSSTQVDIVLMDVHMPVMDGLECTHLIKSHSDSRISMTPVVGLTASIMKEEKARYLKAGMDDVLAKPFDYKELIHRLKRIFKTEHGSK